ncbi:MAG: hypothetical protein GY795_37750 [Desulfobacterales bacterium]|nr:hypothetical protein [Desulfobacterales bacterium]
MKTYNGTDYAHNYDVVIKWMSAVFRGQTLDVLGIKTGRIKDVFGFEPADISVRTGRIDIMFRNEAGDLYHLEEQRNLRKADLYRFAAYHFLAAHQWGTKITDIILTSGDVSIGDRVIKTESGCYSPIIIDLSERNGVKRLGEIREAVQTGEFENWLELVFLPLYGKEVGDLRSNITEQILRFESELYKTEKIPATLLAAALIMSNKLIGKERLKALWEEIKMLDIIEIAREKGIEEGKDLGILENTREMVVDALIEKFVIVPSNVSEQTRKIQNSDALKSLFRQVFRCKNIQEFEMVLNQMI